VCFCSGYVEIPGAVSAGVVTAACVTAWPCAGAAAVVCFCSGDVERPGAVSAGVVTAACVTAWPCVGEASGLLRPLVTVTVATYVFSVDMCIPVSQQQAAEAWICPFRVTAWPRANEAAVGCFCSGYVERPVAVAAGVVTAACVTAWPRVGEAAGLLRPLVSVTVATLVSPVDMCIPVSQQQEIEAQSCPSTVTAWPRAAAAVGHLCSGFVVTCCYCWCCHSRMRDACMAVRSCGRR
jgi:hypothetical protein